MRNLFSNRYVDALAKTILLFGLLHFSILAVIAGHGNVRALNAFTILNLDLVMPSLGEGVVSFAMSYGVVLLVYGLVFHCLTKPIQTATKWSLSNSVEPASGLIEET